MYKDMGAEGLGGVSLALQIIHCCRSVKCKGNAKWKGREKAGEVERLPAEMLSMLCVTSSGKP